MKIYNVLKEIIKEQEEQEEEPKNGFHITHEKNPSFSSKIHYLDGEPDGPAEYYYNNSLIGSGFFDDGKKVGTWKEKIFGIYYVAKYKNGVLDGEYKGYADPNYKNLITDGYYKNGKKFGEWKYYHHNGNIEIIRSFDSDGKKNGKYIKYHNNGSIMEEGTYHNDKKVGEWKKYFDNGNIQEENYYDEDGDLHGICITYDIDGKILKKETYQYGNLKGEHMFWKSGRGKEPGKYIKGKYINGKFFSDDV